MSVTRADVVAEAREWAALNTPWRHQASCKGVGTDCCGLLMGVGIALGLYTVADFDACDYKGYGREPDVPRVVAACARVFLPCADPGPGDILYLKVQWVAHPQHFAIVSDNGYMIHAYAQARKVVENRIDDVWRSRIVRAYSYRGIA